MEGLRLLDESNRGEVENQTDEEDDNIIEEDEDDDVLLDS
jgi:hypothetical protein